MATATQTTERPILFNAAMVRAIFEGRKTQTRRVVKDDPGGTTRVLGPHSDGGWDFVGGGDIGLVIQCPYGKPGDVLWVRETFYFDQIPWSEGGSLQDVPAAQRDGGCLYYRADGDCCQQIPECACAEVGKPTWRSSIHMPRWASRISLRVKSVRVERLKTISEDDTKAEGLKCLTKDDGKTFKYGIPDVDGLPGNDDHGWHWNKWDLDPWASFQTLWDSINGNRPGRAWSDNPWVWVVDFELITA